jgi:hypothetical protein
MFFVLAAKLDLECEAFDIKKAFTESHLREEIWFKALNRVQVKKNHTLRALRSLYGLKQARRD